MVEIDSRPGLQQLLQTCPGELRDVIFQGLDLREFSPTLVERNLPGCILLGCQVDDVLAAHLARQNCLFMPRIPGKPYQPYRVSLYGVEELYAGFHPQAADLEASYRQTPDFQIYATYRDPETPGHPLRPCLVDETLSRRIHDNSISDALDEFLQTLPHRSLVAIMGGHQVARDQPLYREVVCLARELRRRGFLLASGGGPGLMEATNLGAYLAPHEDPALEQALTLLCQQPTFSGGPGAWLGAALRVRQQLPPRAGGESVGIPTWFYGHEPPNAFASHIAKYFENSLREEGLLALALGGIVFAPGGAGTVQEIFQDACQNYYSTYAIQSPMIFYPSQFWTQDMPCYPLMQKLAQKGKFEHLLHLVDDLNRIPELLEK